MTSKTLGDAAKALVRRNTDEVQGGGNFEVFDELFADDFLDHTPQPGRTPDKAGARSLHPEFAPFDRPLPRPVDIMRLLAKGGLPLTMARSVVERIATRNIKARYYHESNRVYIEIAPEPSAETREVANGLDVDLDADGNVIGFDIDNASRLGALLRDFIASGATVEDLARAWASPHDTREEFNKEKGLTGSEAARGNDLGYLGDIEEILQRA